MTTTDGTIGDCESGFIIALNDEWDFKQVMVLAETREDTDWLNNTIVIMRQVLCLETFKTFFVPSDMRVNLLGRIENATQNAS